MLVGLRRGLVSVVSHRYLLCSERTKWRLAQRVWRRAGDKTAPLTAGQGPLVPLRPGGTHCGCSGGLWKPFDQGLASCVGKGANSYIPIQRSRKENVSRRVENIPIRRAYSREMILFCLYCVFRGMVISDSGRS